MQKMISNFYVVTLKSDSDICKESIQLSDER